MVERRTAATLVSPPLSRILRANPPLEGLPSWAPEWRLYQPESVEFIVDRFLSGAKFVQAQASTGAGKSLLAECVRRMLATSMIYVVSTRQLQDQLVDVRRGFPYAATLMGRRNYPTLDFPERFRADAKWGDRITTEDCNKSTNHSCERCSEDDFEVPGLKCEFCHLANGGWRNCPYEVAKMRALISELPVLNYKYWLTEINGPGRFSERPFVTLDEADLIENELLDMVELTFTPRQLERLRIGVPEFKTKPDSWVEWVQQTALPAMIGACEDINDLVDSLGRNPARTSSESLQVRRQARTLNRQKEKLELVAQEMPKGAWVYDYDSTPRGSQRYSRGVNGEEVGRVSFKPLHVDQFGREYLWRHANQFLLMSATLISGDQMAADLGMDDWDPANFLDVPSTFPVENRLVNVFKVARMTKSREAESWPVMAAMVDHILSTYHLNDRVLVHTVSYRWADYLTDYLSQRQPAARLLRYRNADERIEVLDRFKRVPRSVLIAPSMERGVSLEDDQCRAVIVTKVPAPYLGDKRVSGRLNEPNKRAEGESWYATQTIRSLVQSTGRHVRSETDFGTSWILDGEFDRLYRSYEGWFPVSWSDGLRWQGPWRRDLEQKLLMIKREVAAARV